MPRRRGHSYGGVAITEVRGASHVVMTSQPAATTDVILRAVRGK